MALKTLPRLFGGLLKDNTFFKCVECSKQKHRLLYTKWMKSASICGCSTFRNRIREISNRSDSLVIESRHRPLELPNVTVTELLWDKIDSFPDYTAIECGLTGRKYTFAQMKKLSQKFAVSLLKSGIRPGGTVALISHNCPEYPIIIFGCMEAGVVVTLMNYVYTPDEIFHQLKDSGAECIISALDTLTTAVCAVSKVYDSTKGSRKINVIALDPSHDDIPPGITRFSELISHDSTATDLAALRGVAVKSSNLAALPYSSGTTGLSKGVQLSHANLVCNVLQMTVVTDIIETTKDHQDVLPAILPFYHIYGFTGIMMQSMMFGSKVVTLPKFEPKSFLDVVKNQKSSILYLVPPLVLFLSSCKELTDEHFEHLRNVISGAAPIGEGDIQKLLDKIPRVTFKQAYGLTETSPLVCIGEGNSNTMTIGRPVPNTSMKIVSVENGKSLGPNQTGEVCAKGPQIMMGYHNNPSATAATIDSEGWLHTGDVGHYDEDGCFYIADRIKELIKVKGFQVPPAELEELLRTMPGVNDAGVVGIPDQRTGEVPIAYVVPSSNNPPSVSDIKDYVSKKVAPFKQLADVVLVNAIPKSPSGKILRRTIKDTYLNSKQNHHTSKQR